MFVSFGKKKAEKTSVSVKYKNLNDVAKVQLYLLGCYKHFNKLKKTKLYRLAFFIN